MINKEMSEFDSKMEFQNKNVNERASKIKYIL